MVTVEPESRRSSRWVWIVGVLLVAVLAGATIFGWQQLIRNAAPGSTPTSSTAPAPVLSTTPLVPGLEPPRPGNWPSAWPKFTASNPVKTLKLDGLGFPLTVPTTWNCLLADRAAGLVKYNCGGPALDDDVGGELIVRDCPTPCDPERRIAMRRAEEAFGLQWRDAGENATIAETLTLHGARRYGLVVVAYWRSDGGATVNRQVVLRMAAPEAWVDEVRRVANGIREAANF